MPPQFTDKISYLSEEIVEVNIGTQEDSKLIKIGAWLTLEERERYHLLLKEFSNVFSWSYFDMPSLDPNFITHNLVINDNVKPFQ